MTALGLAPGGCFNPASLLLGPLPSTTQGWSAAPVLFVSFPALIGGSDLLHPVWK